MAGTPMPIISSDKEFDGVVAQLGKTRAARRKRQNDDAGQQAALEAEITTITAQLAELRASSAAAIAVIDTRTRILMAGMVRYLTAHWERLRTSPTRVVRASGVKITRRTGAWSIEAPDEDTAVNELKASGLDHLIRFKPTINRHALTECSRPTEDGQGIVVTVGEGPDAREVTLTTVQKVQGLTVWKVELPGHDQAVEMNEEDLAQLLAGS